MYEFRLCNIFLFLVLILIGCSTHHKSDLLKYVSGDEVFTLEKGCVSELSLKEHSYSEVNNDISSVFIKVKNSKECSERFNYFFKKNIGNELSVYFKNEAIIKKTKIMAKIPSEDGYYQAVSSERVAFSILNEYND